MARSATREVYGARDITLTWTEMCGWPLAVATPGDLSDYLTHPLCDKVLPAPTSLVAAVKIVLGEQPQPTGRPTPLYRTSDDYSDEFENQLDAYLGAHSPIPPLSTAPGSPSA